ncbi:MAG TPA: hypothetical protein VKR06_18665 [Ktedonosporobacter sp.]|nr:hypothetical protein [Ktedonosporobacter sp.]
MSYSRSSRAQEQQEACQKATRITEICEELNITLDPIDWQECGMWAPVKVRGVEIAYLVDFGQPSADDILRRVRIKLLEHAALEAIHARPGRKALMWTPVDVMQPQEFLSLWIITLETDERIAIAEFIRNGERVYEHYTPDMSDGHYLTKLFGPMHTGEYQLGDTVTIEEREHRCTGEIVYILPPGKASIPRKTPSRARHTILGKVYTNEDASRYIVNCHDGFPHVVNQWQVVTEK